jgi:hypothetical protein
VLIKTTIEKIILDKNLKFIYNIHSISKESFRGKNSSTHQLPKLWFFA